MEFYMKRNILFLIFIKYIYYQSTNPTNKRYGWCNCLLFV